MFIASMDVKKKIVLWNYVPLKHFVMSGNIFFNMFDVKTKHVSNRKLVYASGNIFIHVQ
jgi:hypothetical protein